MLWHLLIFCLNNICVVEQEEIRLQIKTITLTISLDLNAININVLCLRSALYSEKCVCACSMH